jgi:hypothetical protein
MVNEFMRKSILFMAALCCVTMAHAVVTYGIKFGEVEVTSKNMDDIFGDGKASFDAQHNTLVLQEGFSYSLSKGIVTIDTKYEPFVIRLEGNAQIKASVRSYNQVRIVSNGAYTLGITSNISGSALCCPSLYIGEQATLKVLSRNSQKEMYALECFGTLTIESGSLLAEVTTAEVAVRAGDLVLNGVECIKPKGCIREPETGNLCFGDGTPAKIIRIVPKED